eukprot:tig00000227_g19843.t1
MSTAHAGASIRDRIRAGEKGPERVRCPPFDPACAAGRGDQGGFGQQDFQRYGDRDRFGQDWQNLQQQGRFNQDRFGGGYGGQERYGQDWQNQPYGQGRYGQDRFGGGYGGYGGQERYGLQGDREGKGQSFGGQRFGDQDWQNQQQQGGQRYGGFGTYSGERSFGDTSRF